MPTPAIYEVFEHQQEDLLFHLLSTLQLPAQTLIYVRSRESVQNISTRLSKLEIKNDTLHGKKKEAFKEQALTSFRNGSLPVFVTTEAATRQLELQAELIINFDMPEIRTDFTKRQSELRSSEARYITLVTPIQQASLMKLEQELDTSFQRLVSDNFAYDTKSIKTTGKCKKQNRSKGPRSKPLQNKKPKLRPKHKR